MWVLDGVQYPKLRLFGHKVNETRWIYRP